MKGHALPREEPAQNGGQLFQPPGPAPHGDAEGVEGLHAAAVGERHDEGSLSEGGKGPDLLGEHDGLVEGREQDHSDRHGSRHGHEPSDGRHRSEGVRVGAGNRVIVTEQQSVQIGSAGGRRDLQHVARLLGRVERPHRPFDESAGRQGGQHLFESLVSRRSRGIQEAERGAELHCFVSSPSAGAWAPTRWCGHPP